MTPVVFIALALAGGLGAALRLVVDGFVRARTPASLPCGTTVINLTGSLLLGLVTGLTAGHLLPQQWQAILGSGFLGGYTTFSTASFETVRMLQERRWFVGAGYGLGTVILATALAGLGLWWGMLM